MPDLLSAFNGAIPVGALRSRQLHNRVNKLVIEKKKVVNPVVVGGEDIVVEKIEDLPTVPREKEKVAPRGQEKVFPWRGPQEKHEEKLDNTIPEMVKIDTIQEEVNEPKEQKKEKRKYTKRKSR